MATCEEAPAAPDLHTREQEILALIRAEPGIAISQLRARLGIGWSSLYLKLERLKPLIAFEQSGNHRIVHMRANPHAMVKLAAVLRDPPVKLVALDVIAHPGTTINQIAARLAVSRRQAYFWTRRLKDAGFLEYRKPRPYAIHPTRTLMRRIDETRAEPGDPAPL